MTRQCRWFGLASCSVAEALAQATEASRPRVAIALAVAQGAVTGIIVRNMFILLLSVCYNGRCSLMNRLYNMLLCAAMKGVQEQKNADENNRSGLLLHMARICMVYDTI
jgi:hypothetical protein